MSKRVDMKKSDAINLLTELVAAEIPFAGADVIRPKIANVLEKLDSMGGNICAREGEGLYPVVLASYKQGGVA